MAFNLRGRSYLKLLDFNQREMRYLLDLSRDLKRAKYARIEQQHLKGKNICLIFEKSSTRTMCAFEVAAMDQGAGVVYLGPSGSQIGRKESMKDTACVLGRMFDAIEYRGFGQAIVEELAQYAGVPVFNGLTDEFHPTQMLADLLTMREHADRPLQDIAHAFVGDARSNMGHSLMIAGCLMGMDVRIAAPQANWPGDEYLTSARELAQTYTPSRPFSWPRSEREDMRIVVALGGNALLRRGQPMTAKNQRDNVRVAATALAPLAIEHQLVIAHGNGPQVGLLALQGAAHKPDEA